MVMSIGGTICNTLCGIMWRHLGVNTIKTDNIVAVQFNQIVSKMSQVQSDFPLFTIYKQLGLGSLSDSDAGYCNYSQKATFLCTL